MICTGFWFPQDAPCVPTEKPLLLALIQERIPTHLGAHKHLLRQLNSWARQRPNWTVMVQRDHSWSATTTLMANDEPLADNLLEAAPGQLLPLLVVLHRLPHGELAMEPGGDGLGPDPDHRGRLRHPR